MDGLIAELDLIRKNGQAIRSTKLVADVTPIHDCGIVDIYFEDNGLRYRLTFNLADLIRQATMAVA